MEAQSSYMTQQQQSPNQAATLTLRSTPSTAFDKLAFKAVASTVDDLQKQGVLVLSDTNSGQSTTVNPIVDGSAAATVPFHMSSNVARFFMTGLQADHYSDQEPESWPNMPYSEALRQSYHPQLQQSTKAGQPQLLPALMVGTTGQSIPLFDVTHFFGNIRLPFPPQGRYCEDFTPAAGVPPRFARRVRALRNNSKKLFLVSVLKLFT